MLSPSSKKHMVLRTLCASWAGFHSFEKNHKMRVGERGKEEERIEGEGLDERAA
jgi:hypothetical protein